MREKTKVTSAGLDSAGRPVLIKLANSVTVGLPRQVNSGNPYYDSSTGKFANSPGGLSATVGKELIKLLTNASKGYIGQRARQLGANQIQLFKTNNNNNTIEVRIMKDGQLLETAHLPSIETDPDKADTPNAPDEAHDLHSVIPKGVDAEAWARRMDFVREIAREFDNINIQDVREFANGRSKRQLTEHELANIVEDAKRLRVNDVVDILEGLIRKKVASKVIGRRKVRVAAPRGFLKRALSNLSDNEILEVHRRLIAKGFNSEELEDNYVNRFSANKREHIKELIGNVK